MLSVGEGLLYMLPTKLTEGERERERAREGGREGGRGRSGHTIRAPSTAKRCWALSKNKVKSKCAVKCKI